MKKYQERCIPIFLAANYCDKQQGFVVSMNTSTLLHPNAQMSTVSRLLSLDPSLGFGECRDMVGIEGAEAAALSVTSYCHRPRSRATRSKHSKPHP